MTGDRRGQSNPSGRKAAMAGNMSRVAIDDHSRLGFSQVLKSEKKECAVAFSKASAA
jgi:hypothetical protein